MKHFFLQVFFWLTVPALLGSWGRPSSAQTYPLPIPPDNVEISQTITIKKTQPTSAPAVEEKEPEPEPKKKKKSSVKTAKPTITQPGKFVPFFPSGLTATPQPEAGLAIPLGGPRGPRPPLRRKRGSIPPPVFRPINSLPPSRPVLAPSVPGTDPRLYNPPTGFQPSGGRRPGMRPGTGNFRPSGAMAPGGLRPGGAMPPGGFRPGSAGGFPAPGGRGPAETHSPGH